MNVLGEYKVIPLHKEMWGQQKRHFPQDTFLTSEGVQKILKEVLKLICLQRNIMKKKQIFKTSLENFKTVSKEKCACSQLPWLV